MVRRGSSDACQSPGGVGLVGSQKTLAAIENEADPQAIESEWQEDLAAFQALRAKYLLYQ